MYTLKNKISNVNNFFPHGIELDFWNRDGVFKSGKLVYEGEIVNIHLGIDFCLIEQDFEGNKVLITKDYEKILFHSGMDGVQLVINNERYLRTTFSNDFSKSFLSLYNIKSNEDEWKYAVNLSSIHRIDEDRIILLEASRISIIQISDGKYLYENRNENSLSNIDFSKLSFVGTSNSKIYFAYDHNKIFILDSQLQLDKNNQLIYEHQLAGKTINTKNSIIDITSNAMFTLFHDSIVKLDLESQKQEVLDFSEEFNTNRIKTLKNVTTNPITNDHLYLTGVKVINDGGKILDSECLIIINKNTLSISWLYDFKTSDLGTNVPRITSKKLYQLDNNSTLHIFQQDIQDDDLQQEIA